MSMAKVVTAINGELGPDFRATTDYGFDALTESEARYLANFKPAESVRDRILAERGRRRQGMDDGAAGQGQGSVNETDQPAPPSAGQDRSGVLFSRPVSFQGKQDADVDALVRDFAGKDGAPTEAEIRAARQEWRETERTYGGRECLAFFWCNHCIGATIALLFPYANDHPPTRLGHHDVSG